MLLSYGCQLAPWRQSVTIDDVVENERFVYD